MRHTSKREEKKKVQKHEENVFSVGKTRDTEAHVMLALKMNSYKFE
jgi:3-methyladenine DNA glycosylase AlkD